MRACVRVCVCVCVRERESECVRVSVCVFCLFFCLNRDEKANKERKTRATAGSVAIHHRPLEMIAVIVSTPADVACRLVHRQ